MSMEYFHFVTGIRALFVFTLDFQFVLDLREYSSMYLKSRGGDFFSGRKLFYFEIFGIYRGDTSPIPPAPSSTLKGHTI
jgi:hypothetical protein